MLPRKDKKIPTSRLPALRRVVWSSPLLLIKTEENGLEQNRFAVVVPAKKIKTAADRHRLKRQILASATKLPCRGRDLLFVFRGNKKLTIAGWRAEFDKIKRKV